MKRTEHNKTDVVIIGGGPVGLFAAILLAQQGLRICVLERKELKLWQETQADGREIALTHSSMRMLENIGINDVIPPKVRAPLRKAQIDTAHMDHSLYFSPEDSGEQHTQELGWLVPNYRIRNGLFSIAQKTPELTLCPQSDVISIEEDRHKNIVRTSTKTYEAQLVIAADGRFSRTRKMAGIGAVIHDFHKQVLVCPMAHTLPHHQIALQWFDEGQTLAFLPLHGDVSSLVLIQSPETILQLMNMTDEAFSQTMTQRTNERFGALSLIGKRQTYPLKAVFAHRFIASRLALIGDAAVGMNPITAHGFNLGLKGASLLFKNVMNNVLETGDSGQRKGLRQFERQHRLNTMLLFAGTNFIATLYGREGYFATKLRHGLIAIANKTPIFRRMVTDMLMDEA